MRAILVLLSLAVLATLGWGAYWFAGARTLDRATEQTLANSAQLDAESHHVRGFPNRFDLTVNAPRFTAPGLAWQSPFIQFFALTYRPNHLIAVFASDQRFDFGGEAVAVHSADMRASIVLQRDPSLTLQRSALVAEGISLALTSETHRADALRLASRALTPERHELVLEIENAFPDNALMNMIDPPALWPRRFDILRMEGEIVLDRALDRHAVQGQPAALLNLALTGGRIAWTEGGNTVDLRARGRLEPDDTGRLSGSMTLEVTQWRALMRRARDGGMVAPDHAALAEMALQSMIDPDDPNRLEVTLNLRAGDILLGPVVLGSLPPLF